MTTPPWLPWLLLLLVAVSGQLLNMPDARINQTLTSSATNRTYTYDLNTGGQGYINVYLEPRINQHQGQPGPQYSSTVYLYAQILFNGTGATRALSFDEIDNNEVDGNGFVMMKNQLLSLKRTDHSPPLAVGNMTVTVFVFASVQNTQVDVQFNLTVNTSMAGQCPNNCSGSGTCDAIARTCSCSNTDSGYDCSVTQQVLNLKTESGFFLRSGQLAYAVVPSDLTTSSLILNIAKATDKNCTVVFRMNEASTFDLMSIFEGTGKDLSGSLYQATYQTNPFGGKLFIVVDNFGPDDCQVTISVTEQATVSILLIIMIVLGVAILIALIIGIIYIVRKRREFRVQPREFMAANAHADSNLTAAEIQRYFPVVVADKVMNARARNQSSLDLIPTQDCVICLCMIDRAELIRVTYCNHLFHRDCLTGWFKKLQNCPYCRETFSKEHVQELYEKVRDFARKGCKNRYLELQGDSLAVQIVEYHLSTKSGSQQELQSVKSPRRQINIETLE